jgi:hypothetical protein
MNEIPPFFANAIAMFESETDCIIAEVKGAFKTIEEVSPFLNFTSGVLSVTFAGVQSFVVNPGIRRYSLKVLEISFIMCAMINWRFKKILQI